MWQYFSEAGKSGLFGGQENTCFVQTVNTQGRSTYSFSSSEEDSESPFSLTTAGIF